VASNRHNWLPSTTSLIANRKYVQRIFMCLQCVRKSSSEPRLLWLDVTILSQHFPRLSDVGRNRLYRHLHGGTKENHEKRQSGYPLSRPVIEPSASMIKIYNFIAAPTCSLSFFGICVKYVHALRMPDRYMIIFTYEISLLGFQNRCPFRIEYTAYDWKELHIYHGIAQSV
jgi:hypothetical protein